MKLKEQLAMEAADMNNIERKDRSNFYSGFLAGFDACRKEAENRMDKNDADGEGFGYIDLELLGEDEV